MVGYRLTDWFQAGAYYSVHFVDADDRSGAERASCGRTGPTSATWPSACAST